MRILVTGRDGQVARSLAERAPAQHDVIFVQRPELDLADFDTIHRVIEAERPDLIFNVAAYTAVDKAESEPALAMAVNGTAPGVLARAAAEIGAGIVHLSTDYVFDGTLDRPYLETDPVSPINVYGETKLAGEQAVAASGARYAILRTAWVYSPFGRNFVKTILALAAQRDELTIVNDQWGCPTSAFDIADALFRIADRWAVDPQHGADAIYHLAGGGETNWAEFAREILAMSIAHGGKDAEVRGIPATDYPTPARRPSNSRLDSRRFAQLFGYVAPEWRASLAPVVRRLLA
ncbi:dTDP-4-dehydrorhamnose reductase [Sphingomonas kyeonggiensis]|uniref:dTDP-4-dehydrorhamnose reductase n=1 Tax=Sphingomonas kyeonggiensis TaxID=1268553 RepID=A0A7W7K338_9SPHN|nr:dTDP-4-dehydrorhamnose reductase [Sphingomonas kyeonggiensis]MBB4839796.1 dTDP-4-dehydrorhamnose reductase [Sphingomonas kyeonggiensis]